MSVPGDAEGNQPAAEASVTDHTPAHHAPWAHRLKTIGVILVAVVLPAVAITTLVTTQPALRTPVLVFLGVTAPLVTFYNNWRNRH
jgi:hypothetical protein